MASPTKLKISFRSFAKLGESAPFRDSAPDALGCFQRLWSHRAASRLESLHHLPARHL